MKLSELIEKELEQMEIEKKNLVKELKEIETNEQQYSD